MVTEIKIKGHIGKHSYWINSELAAESNLTGYLTPKYTDQPYLHIMWCDLSSAVAKSANQPLLDMFEDATDSQIDLRQLSKLDFVLDADYQEILGTENLALSISSADEPDRNYREGVKSILCFLAVPLDGDAQIQIGLGDKVLTTKSRPKFFGDRFELYAEKELFAEISTGRIFGSGKLTIFDDLPKEQSIPFAAMCRRLASHSRNRA